MPDPVNPSISDSVISSTSDHSNPPLIISHAEFTDGFLDNHRVRFLVPEGPAFFDLDGESCILCEDFETNRNTPLRIDYPERVPEPKYRYPPIAPDPAPYVHMLPYIFVRIPPLEETPDGVNLEPAPIPIVIARPELTAGLISILDRYNPGIAVAHLDLNTAMFVHESFDHVQKYYRAIIFDTIPEQLADIHIGQPVFLQLDRP